MKRLLQAFTGLIFAAIPVQGADRDIPEISDFPHTVTITFSGNSAVVQDSVGLDIQFGTQTSELSVQSAVKGVHYILTGTSAAGHVQITSTHRALITLDGLHLTSSGGPAVSFLSTERCFIEAAEGSSNSLVDSGAYLRPGSATLHCGGHMILTGSGALSVTGSTNHALYAGKSIRILDGSLTVPAATKDAIHPKTQFRIDGGSLDLTATGDGIDADNGISIHGGSMNILSIVDGTRGIKTDATIEITAGRIHVDVRGASSKGLDATGDILVSGGTLLLHLTGSAILETISGGAFTYIDPAYCSAIKTDATFTMTGGNLAITHTGTGGKGISSNGNVVITGGRLDIATLGGSSSSFTAADGLTDTASPDAIKADGSVLISGGVFDLRSDGAGSDSLSAGTHLTISAGSFNITTRGNQSKGIKSLGTMTLAGGTFIQKLSGGVVLETVATSRFDPSYCSAIKCSGNLSITGGTHTITHSGLAGKGVSADGTIHMSGGNFNITVSGGPSATFTNSTGVTDRAAADCFKSDLDLTLAGGTLTAIATGIAGDAISSEGAAVIGVNGSATGPTLSASATGARVLASGSDYMNCKAIKAMGKLTMESGSFTGLTSSTGCEGMESKTEVVINGGSIAIQSYDDSINAASKITINGGTTYCYASNNDGIDSNGTILVTGGLTVSSGSNAPEEGFDCDNFNFTITGGVIVGTGGATSSPTASTSTQRSVIYRGAGTANVYLRVASASGNVLVYRIPRTYSGGGGPGGSSTTPMTLLFSLPSLTSGTTYSIISGATVSGGTEFRGYFTGATATGGTTLRTFNPTAMVTTVQ